MWCQQARWSVESVHTKNIVSILHLLVALARHFRWNSWSSWFWRSSLLLMVPENSTKMVHNPFRAPIRLPENVVVDVVIVTKREGVRPEFLCLHWSPTYVFLQVLTHRVIAEELTSFYDDVGMRCERDAFDTLFDHAPDKLQVPGLQHISFELALNDGELMTLSQTLCWYQIANNTIP